MKTKFFIIILLALLSGTLAYAQREILPVDWKKLKKVVKNEPELVKSLVERLTATKLDSTLTFNDRIIAFYGQALLSNNEEDTIVRDMTKLYNNGQFEESFEKAQEAIQINPLNIQALYTSAMAISEMNEKGDTTHTIAEGQIFYNIVMRIFNTIAYTGYGTKKHPFYITKVSDEYAFMRYYLELREYGTQSLEGMCDVFELTETSKYYQEPKIYFDATLPLESLMKAFGKIK